MNGRQGAKQNDWVAVNRELDAAFTALASARHIFQRYVLNGTISSRIAWPRVGEPEPKSVTAAPEMASGDDPNTELSLDSISSGSMSWQDVIRAHMRRKHLRLGRQGVEILIRLIESAGEWVSHDELMHAARTDSAAVVKVNICRLRQALREPGRGGEIIRTGRVSYAVTTDHVPVLLKFILN